MDILCYKSTIESELRLKQLNRNPNSKISRIYLVMNTTVRAIYSAFCPIVVPLVRFCFLSFDLQ